MHLFTRKTKIKVWKAVCHSTGRVWEKRNTKGKVNIKTEWILAFTKGRRQTEAFDEEKLRCWLGYEKS